MKTEKITSERGQAIVLLVLGMVALLGFTALAIDGGMVYSDRRHAQNASDASSLAGAATAAMYLENHSEFVDYSQWNNCKNSYIYNAEGEAIPAAIARAGDNGYTIDDKLGDHNGVTVICGDYYNGFWYERYLDVRTMITADTQTAFAHFVFNGPLRNTVEAIARIRPRTPLAFGNAIVGLNKADCGGNQNGVQFGGSTQTLVNGGGIFSNGCMGSNGSEFGVSVTGGKVLYAGEQEGGHTNSNISPKPRQASKPLPESSYLVPPPDCSHLPARTQSGDTISRGVYNRISLSGTKKLFMNPGLYCITGGPDAIKVTGGILEGYGVTLYVTSGDVSISGGAEVQLFAPGRVPDPSPAIPGILIYLAPGFEGTVELEGNETSKYFGTILAPDGDIKVTGVTGMHPTFSTQLVGKDVFVSGNALIDINFEEQQNYNTPTTMELFK